MRLDPKLRAIIVQAAEFHRLEPAIVTGIVMVESGGLLKTARFEPDYKWLYEPEVWAQRHRISVATERALQKTSWGPMHVMGASARERGFTGWIPDLCDPNQGIEYGCRYLRYQLTRYQGKIFEAVSAYNAGRELCDLEGCVDEEYVVKVLEFASKF